MTELTPDEKKEISDAWNHFFESTLVLDATQDTKKGWHWFWGLYYLYHCPDALNQPENFNLEEIYKKLPDQHWLKKVNLDDLETIHNKNKENKLLRTMYELHSKITIKTLITNKIGFYTLLNHSPINCSNFIFPTDTIFGNSRFFRDVNLNGAVFLKNVYFNGVEFYETANFKNATFHGKTANFSGAIFRKIADFNGATFNGYGNFKSAKFKGRTSFQKTEFKSHAPRFYGAKFNNEMTFSGIIPPKFGMQKTDRINEYDKEITDKEEIHKNYKERIQENQNSYENTAILLEQHNKYHDRHFFFRQEMYCRRRLERPLIKPFYWAYELFSDYGYGVGRAFTAWFLHIVLGTLLVALVDSCAGGNFKANLPCYIPVSFANANPYAFVGFESDTLAKCYETLETAAPIGFSIVKIIQTVIGVTLLFLVGLTLRTRFRLAQGGVQVIESEPPKQPQQPY